jgi:hypothetical protein
VRSLPDLLTEPDSTALLVGAFLLVWIAWISVELVAIHLIWRRRAAGRWILVGSLGLRGIGQIGPLVAFWPLLARTPSFALVAPCLFYEIRATFYCGLVFWLLFFSPFEIRASSPPPQANTCHVTEEGPADVQDY